MSQLHLAAVYTREVAASLARIWEIVFDWEHLAHLHEGSFAKCTLIDRGAWGWRVALATAGRPEHPQVIELRADRPAGRYVSTTIEGTGAGTEIRVRLVPQSAHCTNVMIEFHVPEDRNDRLAVIGAAYTAAYRQLWDEDEAMMQTRERMLALRSVSVPAVPVDLGRESEVRSALPLAFDFGGQPFRVVDLDPAQHDGSVRRAINRPLLAVIPALVGA